MKNERKTGNYREQENVTDLNMKIPRKELFDPYVLTPHNELNESIYHEVDKLIEYYGASHIDLCIFTDRISSIIQEKAVEIFKDHYQDRLKKAREEMWRVYIRAVCLIVISIALLYFCMFFSRNNPNRSIFFLIVSNFGCYFLWQVGDTCFDWIYKKRDIARIETAMNAHITFAEYGKKNS